MPFVPDWFYGSGSAFAVLCAAFAFDAVFGSLPGFRHFLTLPAGLTRVLVRRADRRLNRSKRSTRSRRLRGALVVLFLLAASIVTGMYAAAFCRSVPDGWIVETVLIAMCIGLQRPVITATVLRRAIAASGLDRGRLVLEGATGVEAGGLDAHGLARGSVELFAVRLCDGLVGPVFWYALAGLPGLFAYRVAVTIADSLPFRTPSYAAFGAAAAAMDRLFNALPAPLTGALIVAGSLFSPTARPVAAFRGAFAGAGVGRLPREGWTFGAVAGALGLCLAGPRRMNGELAPGGWIGDGRARATATDIARAAWLYLITIFLGLVPVALLALVVARP